MKLEVTTELEKVTKGTFVYQVMDSDPNPNPVCKSALPKVPPPTITLTVEWRE